MTLKKNVVPSKEVSSIDIPKNANIECQHCHQHHLIRNCSRFLQLDVDERRAKAKLYRLCYNCLSMTHLRFKCPSKMGCRRCGKKHHTSLHKENLNQSFLDLTGPKTNNKGIHTTKSDVPLFHSTLLSTAIIKIKSYDGSWTQIRALIDQGGEASVITERACQILKLNKSKCNVNVTHLSDTPSECSSFVSIHLQSCHNKFTIKSQALVMKSLISLPSQKISFTD